MSDEDSQADELLALENIYTPEEFKSLNENGQLGGHFLAFIVFENELKLLFRDLREPESSFEELLLDHLPPLSLLFSFPKDYPSSSPPDFTLSCQWLRKNDIAKLCRKLDAIWDENKGMEIMYIWTQFLKEEALKFLGMNKELDISKMYTYYLKCMETWRKRSKGLYKRWELAGSDSTSLPVAEQQRAMEKGAIEEAVEEGAMKNSMKESRAEKAKVVGGVEKAREEDEGKKTMEKGGVEKGMENGGVEKGIVNGGAEKGIEKGAVEKSIEKDGREKSIAKDGTEKTIEKDGIEKAMKESRMEKFQQVGGVEKAMEEDGVVKAKEEGWVEKAVQESGVIKIMDSEMEKTLSKGDQNCTEQQRLLEYNVLVVDRDNSKENHVCGTMAGAVAAKTAEESKCSLQGAMQNCCRNTNPLNYNPAGGPARRRFSPENVQSTKETGYNRRYRSSRELKGGKNRQNMLSQKRLEPSKENDTNKVDTATCNTTCDMSTTELKDTVNESKKHGDLGLKFCRKQGTNHVGETKLYDHNSSKVDHTAISELSKTDMRSDCVGVNANTYSARGNGGVRQRRNVRKPRNSFQTEQEKETRQSQMRHRHRQVDKRAIVDLHPRTSVIQHLVDYNIKQRELLFERNMHTCTICFEDKPGVYCMKFEPCRHVFCSDCITNYFEVRIMEGTVLSIPCPEDKCPSEAQPSDVRALVSPEMYTKYDSILLSAVLDMQSNVYCPRRQCRYPVFHEDKTDKLATCPECNYAFCVLCEKVYHGVAPCVIVPEEKRKLMEEYVRASNVKKRKMEAKYGKQQLKNLVDTFHLEWSESWIKKNSKKCPHCNTAIEKAAGCNKMQCLKCDTFFCWLCNTRLDKLKPYDHFNNPKSPCYNNLLHGIVMAEDFDDEFEFEEDFDEEEEEEILQQPL